MSSNINRLIERRLNTPLQTINRKEYIEDLLTIKSEIESLQSNGNQESEWNYTEVNISKAQIENMGSIPIELLPAPNTNEYYDINKIALEYTYGTVPYTLANDHITFNNYSAYIHKTLIIVPFNTAIIASNNSGGLLDTIDTNLALQNQINGIGNNVQLTTYNGNNPTGGDGTLKAKIWYKIVTFG